MSETAMGLACAAHRHREWVPLEVHHVWPLGEGGPNRAWNRVTVCANAHSSIHDLLGHMLRGPVPWTVRRRYGRKVRALADKGYAAIITARAGGHSGTRPGSAA